MVFKAIKSHHKKLHHDFCWLLNADERRHESFKISLKLCFIVLVGYLILNIFFFKFMIQILLYGIENSQEINWKSTIEYHFIFIISCLDINFIINIFEFFFSSLRNLILWIFFFISQWCWCVFNFITYIHAIVFCDMRMCLLKAHKSSLKMHNIIYGFRDFFFQIHFSQQMCGWLFCAWKLINYFLTFDMMSCGCAYEIWDVFTVLHIEFLWSLLFESSCYF